jgi:hypothetical protein
MIVVAHAVVDLATRMAALDLDRGMADGEALAQPRLDVAHDVLSIAKRRVLDHHVTAQRHGLR